MVENIVGKGENAIYQIFSFPTMFSKAFFLRVIKSRDCLVKELNKIPYKYVRENSL